MGDACTIAVKQVFSSGNEAASAMIEKAAAAQPLNFPSPAATREQATITAKAEQHFARAEADANHAIDVMIKDCPRQVAVGVGRYIRSEHDAIGDEHIRYYAAHLGLDVSPMLQGLTPPSAPALVKLRVVEGLNPDDPNASSTLQKTFATIR